MHIATFVVVIFLRSSFCTAIVHFVLNSAGLDGWLFLSVCLLSAKLHILPPLLLLLGVLSNSIATLLALDLSHHF